MIGVGSPRVWISNEFAGARLSDFKYLPDSTFEISIKPELAPINNSPWYSFAIWAEDSLDAKIRISYEDGKHRYIPKISLDKENWSVLSESDYLIDEDCGCIEFNLPLTNDTTYVSAQELRTTKRFEKWLSGFSDLPYVEVDTIGFSDQGRPILEMMMDETGESTSKAIVIISRQHPPEVTGYLAMQAFIDGILEDTPIANAFREKFRILVFLK